jgi:cellulose biosynthesis protein BcsQ
MEQQKSKKAPVYAAFSTQKGGAGKTTMTVLVASYLHYVKGYNVAVIDCDYPQHSICDMRERDYKMVEQDVYYKKMAREQILRLGGKGFYPVIDSRPQGALNEAKTLCTEGEYDFIFFDLPGTINDREVINTLAKMDYIIAPITADKVVAESTLNYLISIRENVVNTGKSKIKSMFLFWNMVDGREKSPLYGAYEALIKNELQFPVLKTVIPNSLRFRHEQTENHRPLFRSTLFPVDRSLVKGSNIDSLTDELSELLK